MRGDQAESGASLVEYVLLVALVAVVALPAIGWVRDATLDRYERSAIPGSSPSEGTTTTAPATTAPPAPTTAPATTTTRPATTTTTTRPATTTTAPPIIAKASFGSVTSSSINWYTWSGSASVVVTDASGRPVAGAQVQIRVTPAGGSATTVTVTTDSSGRATVEVGPYIAYGGYGTGSAEVKVAGIGVQGGSWDGTSPARTIPAP